MDWIAARRVIKFPVGLLEWRHLVLRIESLCRMDGWMTVVYSCWGGLREIGRLCSWSEFLMIGVLSDGCYISSRGLRSLSD